MMPEPTLFAHQTGPPLSDHLTLYSFSPSAPCLAVKMVAKILALDYHEVEVDLFKDEQKSSEYHKINSLGNVPCLVDGGLSMSESRAIITYLCEKYGGDGCQLYPSNPELRGDINCLLMYDAGTLNPAVAEYVYPPVLQQAPVEPSKWRKVEEKLTHLNSVIGANGGFAAGDHLTLADVGIFATLHILMWLDVELKQVGGEQFPHLVKWIAVMRSLVPDYENLVLKNIIKFRETFGNK